MGGKKSSKYWDSFDLFGTRKGLRASGSAEAASQKEIARQKQTEQIKLAEEGDVVARKRGLATRAKGGRASLLATSPTGAMNTTLGGT